MDLVNYWLEKQSEHAFLEEVHGDAAIDWVKKKNEMCLGSLGDPTGRPLYDKVLSILDCKDKIPHVVKYGEFYYNFWQDAVNKRGLWRRTTLESYRSDCTEWETVLDIDELCSKEDESWVYKGHSLYDPVENILSNGATRIPPKRTLMKLSRGGSDAVVMREFDLEKKEFVTEENKGFVVPEAKSSCSWINENTLLIGTDMKDSKSLTDSGYPRVVRVWRRGTPLEESTIVFEGSQKDVAAHVYMSHHDGILTCWKHRSLTFYTSKKELCVIPLPSVEKGVDIDLDHPFSPIVAAVMDDTGNCWRDLSALPEDVQSVEQFSNQLVITLRSEWTTKHNGVSAVHRAGSLLAVSIEDFIANGVEAYFHTLFEPSADGRISLSDTVTTKNYLILETLDNVKSKLQFWKFDRNSGWQFRGSEENAVTRGTHVTAVDSDTSNSYWLTVSSFLTPSTLCLCDAELEVNGIVEAVKQPLKALPHQFEASGCEEFQLEATSKDGTKIPYFVVRSKPTGATENKPVPTLMYGYGGFEIPILPSYMAVTGLTWLEKGYCFVVANIRGGGEFGPQWHQAALKSNRNKSYEDFIAVGEDLVARGITTPEKLGIRGGSNGGLLMGNVFVSRPDLFGAVICQVPLLDMKRFHKLLAGASWMAEYGDPDSQDWEHFLYKYSAYHNIQPVSQHNSAKGAAVAVKSNPLLTSDPPPKYPPLFMATSTRDDRVHPYHARSFVKRLEELDMPSLYYYENMEGGHGGAADNKQQAYVTVLYNEFLYRHICQ